MNEEKNGAICGGVISRTEFFSNTDAYMMAYVMPDDKFREYIQAKEKNDEATASELFDLYAMSMV